MAALDVDGLEIEVVRKRVKHMRISVHPPNGRVRVSAPHRIDEEAIRVAVSQRLPWIRKHQDRLRSTLRPLAPRMVSGESHPVWGERCRLVVSHSGRTGVELRGDTLFLTAPAGADTATKLHILDRWYHAQMSAALPALIATWQPVIGEEVSRITIRRMTSRWGSCTPSRRTIRLNLELATRHPRCLEYVLVHELVHLLERSHNARFHALMDRFLPTWREIRDELNRRHTLREPSSSGDVD